MDTQLEKVYVAVSNDQQEGTLEWALKNWSSQSVSIVILYVDNSSKNFINTPFGKLPVSSVSDEKLENLRMCEQEKIDNLLFKYKATCGKVRAEILKIEKSEEPIQKVILGLISKHRITKLVMGITFMKSSSWKSKSAISGSFYVHKHKPDYCELFIICGGKLVFLREESEDGYVQDEQGVMVTKMKEKASFKGWLGKMFIENQANHSGPPTYEKDHANHMELCESRDRWKNYANEIENYLQILSNSKVEEEEDCASSLSPTKQPKLDFTHPNARGTEKIETLRAKLEETRKIIEESKKETKANMDRQTKAERIISLCNQRAGELECRINEEIANQIDLRRDLDVTREQIYEVSSDIEESKSRLNSIQELQSELANKLRCCSSARSSVEAGLEKAVTERAETLREIDELRRQKDVLRRRIEFCREREAIGRATSSKGLNYNYREFTGDEIREATDNFSECMRLECGSEKSSVFKGRLNHATVAIKMQTSLSQEEFQAKMELLCQISQPHLISIVGACPDPKCIVFEYMHNGSLQDILFYSNRKPTNHPPCLTWYARIRITAEIFSCLSFLHLSKPKPIIHGNLNPSNILLDHNLVAKITNFRIARCEDESELQSDISAFGVLMLQILTGREEVVVLAEKVMLAMECGVLFGLLDEVAGEWPLDLAEEFVRVAMRCVHVSGRGKEEMNVKMLMSELAEMRKKAADLVERGGGGGGGEVVSERGGADKEEYDRDVPKVYVCPIFQDVMKDPHVAEDGFSYELEAIEEWLGKGHETSPMTNLKLKNKTLTPNHTLRSLINDWQNKPYARK